MRISANKYDRAYDERAHMEWYATFNGVVMGCETADEEAGTMEGVIFHNHVHGACYPETNMVNLSGGKVELVALAEWYRHRNQPVPDGTPEEVPEHPEPKQEDFLPYITQINIGTKSCAEIAKALEAS